MTIRLTTWHSEDFDIYTEVVDPRKSGYAWMRGYVEKVEAFYRELGVSSALWTFPEGPLPEVFELCKPIEYLLEVNDDRVVAYVDGAAWSEYLQGRQADFPFSTTPKSFAGTSILIHTPVKKEEVKAKRRYRRTGRPTEYKLVEEIPL